MVNVVATIFNAKFVSDAGLSKEYFAERGKELRSWYMTAYQRLIVITSKLFDNAEEIKSLTFLSCLRVTLMSAMPTCPAMFLIKSDNLQTLLFSNELSNWTSEDQLAILKETHWDRRYEHVVERRRIQGKGTAMSSREN